MKNFKVFFTEARMTSHEEIVNKINSYKKAGEILNPEYKDLVIQSKRVFGTEAKQTRDLILKHMHAGDRSIELTDLYYSWPDDSFVSLNKAEKLLKNLKDAKLNDVVSTGGKFIQKWKPIANDIKELKDKVVKVSQKRAEVKAAAEKVMDKKKADSSALIKIFEQHMNEYINAAKTRAKEFIDKRLEILKNSDWDLNKVAPVPSSKLGRDEYMAAKNKRDLYKSITKSTTTSLRTGQPDIREPNKQMINHYIDQAAKGAEAAYRDFMEKMIKKIGKPVVDASMTGSIWTDAILHVTTDDGEKQSWKTQMILNFSKYQKMFNQFPTRRLK